MKRVLHLILILVLLSAAIYTPAFADIGDGNIDSGDGGMGSGSSSENYWNNEDGVRITVLHEGSTVACFDWSNQSETSVMASFVRKSKLDYFHGSSLAPSTTPYLSTVLAKKMPTIIGGAGGNNITAIRTYFTSELIAKYIANGVGIPYDDLIGGEYKLLLEPIAYFTFQGIKYAMTATEAAKFDVMMGGQLYAWMKSLTHQNLPLSMFLQKDDPDLGLYHWAGPTTGKQSAANIITYLGMGIVSFTGEEEEPEPSQYDYEFHTDTDVIVSFHLTNNTGNDITPDSNAYVTLNVGGVNYNRQFVCPAGGTQLIWIRWHTPSTPQVVTMTATCDEIPILNKTLIASVTELTENEPPDPTYYDRDDDFSLKETPDYGNHTETSWGEWYSYWHPNIVTHSGSDWVSTGTDADGNETGYWDDWSYTVDEGWWYFEYTSYYADLSVDYALLPDDRCQTAYQVAGGETTMRSGYGIQVELTPSVTYGPGVSSYDVTDMQNAVATFPEFGFETYNRLLEKTEHNIWRFKKSVYSYYGSRIHYTPLWYPDDMQYTVPVYVLDAWTPGGELTATVSSSLLIYGSCLDDWYIHITD